MKTIFLDDHTILNEPCVATIGFFDGVHKGHQFLIHQVTEEAKRSDLKSVVVTFDRHPREVLQSDYIPTLLTTTDQKLKLLSETSVDIVVVLHFTVEMASLTAKQFMTTVLSEQLNVRKLVIGYDHRFGHDRTEGFDDYVRYGRELNMDVILNQVFKLEGSGPEVSSSYIRRLLTDGDVEMARRCLGHPYVLSAHVVRGFQEGRKLGFPTANLDMNELHQLIPLEGVYAVKARFSDQSPWLTGMSSIGTRPTYNGTNVSVETNILGNFHEDVYGKVMEVAFFKRFRSEFKFNCVEELRNQMIEDEKMINDYFLNLENYE